MKKRYITINDWIINSIWIFAFSFFILLFHLNLNKTYNIDGGVHAINMHGSYREKPGDFPVFFDEIERIECKGFGSIVIDARVKETIPAGNELMFLVRYDKIKVYIDDELVLSEDKYTERWEFIKLDKDITPETRILIGLDHIDDPRFTPSFKNTLFKMRSGTRYALFQNEMHHHIYAVLICLSLIFIGMGNIFSILGYMYLDKTQARGSIACAVVIISGAVCCLIDYDYVTLIFPNDVLVNAIDLLSQFVICASFVIYMSAHIKHKTFKAICGVIVNMILLISTIGYVLYCFDTADYSNVRVYMFITIVTLGFVETILLFIDYLVTDRKLYKEQTLIVISSAVLCVIAVGAVIDYYITKFNVVFLFLLALIVFALIHLTILVSKAREGFEKAKQAEEYQMQLLQNKVNHMTAQMRPHFIYNILTTITALIRKKPDLAAEAAVDFIDYLRGNIDAMDDTGTIPFEKELLHLKKYVYLEKLRFADKIDINYDIQVDDFILPALTVEPLVENSIKHGVNQKDEPLIVDLKTEERDGRIYITIIDNGPGFKEGKEFDDGRAHVGLKNVINRVKLVANGEVTIKSKIGEGTIVTIILPREDMNNENSSVG